MNVLQAATLGLIQGLGEFLPISSSGHLLLARFLLGIQAETPDIQSAYKMLDILLHIGTLIPVIIVFWKDWIQMIVHPIRNRTLLYLILASVPTLAIYLAAKVLFPSVHGFSVFDNGWFLGVSFLITSLFLVVCDILSSVKKPNPQKEPGILSSIVMGLFQGIGLIPGVSRSGSTILGGVFSGLEKKKAAKFSFMMSAPAIMGSLLMEGKDALASGDFAYLDIVPTIVGIIVAAVSGFLAIRFMMKMIEKIPLCWFAIYLAIIGIAYLAMQLSGVSFLPVFAVPGV